MCVCVCKLNNASPNKTSSPFWGLFLTNAWNHQGGTHHIFLANLLRKWDWFDSCHPCSPTFMPPASSMLVFLDGGFTATPLLLNTWDHSEMSFFSLSFSTLRSGVPTSQPGTLRTKPQKKKTTSKKKETFLEGKKNVENIGRFLPWKISRIDFQVFLLKTSATELLS